MTIRQKSSGPMRDGSAVAVARFADPENAVRKAMVGAVLGGPDDCAARHSRRRSRDDPRAYPGW
jgi:hypothetical protein